MILMAVKACSDATSSAPNPAPAMNRMTTMPSSSPAMVTVVRRTPCVRPWLMHRMAPDPGEMAITQAARKKASQTCSVMMVPRDVMRW